MRSTLPLGSPAPDPLPHAAALGDGHRMKARKDHEALAGGKVFLVDDEPSVRRALTRLLRAAGLEVASFPSAEALLAEVGPSESGPACVVADLQMPGLTGLGLQDELARRGLGLPLLVVTGHADVPSTVRAMKGGAIDFLEKPVSESALLEGIGRALSRHRDLNDTRRQKELLEARLERLTPREREVFALVAAGLLNKQVGFELGTTEKTIKVHRARVMEKMEATSLADLVRMAGRLGITAPPPRAP
jgi:FixJ family two-component response regulator